MVVKKLKLKNFRAYIEEIEINFDSSFTAFIGKNDAGKSTIFDALDIFFDNSKPDISDLSIGTDNSEFEISVIFEELPESIEIDTSATTSLESEFLVNDQNQLEVKKLFKCTQKSVSKPDVFIVANYPTEEKFNNLHTKKNTELKEIGRELGVTVDDAKINHLWRKALWNSSPDLKLGLIELKIEDFETKSKKIYTKIEENMPLFFVFKVDREMTDGDSEAKDPMQIAVKEAQNEFKDDIDKLKAKIQERVEEVTNLALDKLKEVNPELAKKLSPKLKSTPSWKFDYMIEDERGVALNKRGSGTRRLVLLNFFRAQAEKKGKESQKGIVYAIEEPETSQHPNNQKMIIEALVDLANVENRQLMITTHSPELLADFQKEYPKSVKFIQATYDGEIEIIEENDAIILAAAALGILSKKTFGTAEKIVLVEGKPDCVFLEHVAKLKGYDLSKVEVLPVGGSDGVKNWIELKKHKGIGLKTFVFLDSDRLAKSDSKTTNEDFIEELADDENIVKAFCTSKREIENYINETLVNCEFGDFDDAKLIISKKNSVRKNEVVSMFWTQMHLKDIDKEIVEIIQEIYN